MDPRHNPFAPGAGTQPPELSGREGVLDDAKVALARAKDGRPAKSMLLLGLRGVGKTVLLNRIAELADEAGFLSIILEAPEDRRLAELVVPPLRSALFQMSRTEQARTMARRALGALRAFAKAFKVSVGDFEFSVEAEQGTADSGNLESDLPALMLAAAAAAKQAGRGIALLLDEVQYLGSEDLSALIVTAHRLAQKNLPFLFFGAGLPQLAGLVGDAKSYAERLFDFRDIGPLDPKAAGLAIATPLRREHVDIEPLALDLILQKTNGYAYFLQEWGSQSWKIAKESPIRAADVESASTMVLAAMDHGFFRVRLDRLTPRERDYVRAMAELGAGPHRSGEIARMLGIGVEAAGPLRSALIRKGMIYSPQHGDTAFTVPLFHEFLQRTMPDWRKPANRPAKKGRR